jgi:hypothetical protein
MKFRFTYDGHEILFYRGMFRAKLIIDGLEHDKQEGFRESQMSSFDLYGMLVNGERVHLHIELGFPGDMAYLYIDDRLITKKEVI